MIYWIYKKIKLMRLKKKLIKDKKFVNIEGEVECTYANPSASS